MFNRRDLLKKSAMLVSTLSSLRLNGLVTQADTIRPDAGEIYAGFLLLPEGTPTPSFVTPPRYGVPIFCTSSNALPTPGGSGKLPVVTHFATHAATRKYAGIPLYTIDASAHGLQESQGVVLSQAWGEVATVTMDYVPVNGADGRVSLWASTQFPQPKPFWFNPAEPVVDIPGQPEKVDFLPTSGLQVASGYGLNYKRLGYAMYWITRRILYWLIVEDYSTRSRAQSIAESLQLAN